MAGFLAGERKAAAPAMPDPLRIACKVASRCAVGIALVGSSLFSLKSCVAPYSAASYKDYNPDVLYATICHEGKVTMGVPADEWPEHKEHGDYRGPCRNRGPVGPAEPPLPDETLIAYEGNRKRHKASEEAFARERAQLQLDSTTTARGEERLREDPDR